MSLAFKVGDQAVYAGYGVGVIKSIEKREISGSTEVFYSVQIQDTQTNILVPQNRTSAKGGLRPIASKRKILEIIDILKGNEITMKKINNWNKKLQGYMKKLKTGSLADVACVLKDLSLMKEKKNLSFGEKQLMETAWNLLFKEMAMVIGSEKSRCILSSATGVDFQQKH